MKLISFQFSCPIEDFSRYIHLVDNFASGYSEAVKTNCTECLKIEEWLKIIHYLTILLLTTGWVGSSLSMGGIRLRNLVQVWSVFLYFCF